MKKCVTFFLSLVLVLALAGCIGKPNGTTGLIKLDEVKALVSEKGYTGEKFKEKLSGLFNEDIIHSWGEPDGCLSGFWGEIWNLDDNGNRFITLYYDREGYVEDVVVGTKETSEVNRTISQDEAEEIALSECKVNYAFIETEFDANNNVWEIGFWEDNASIASQTILIDATGEVLAVRYAE